MRYPNSRRSDNRSAGGVRTAWLQILLWGLLIWAAGVAAVLLTQDPILVPGVFLTGSFLVPFALLFWVFERIGWGPDASRLPTALDPYRLLLAFATGGALGVTCSAVLENVLLKHLPHLYYLCVAVVEELVKLALVWLLARHLRVYRRRDGMLLGATVGLGFAAFESAGYAFNAVQLNHAHDWVAVLQTQATRGLLTPIGHALWTALVAGAFFAAARGGRLRVSWSVVGWLGVAIGLHFAWDAAGGVAALAATASAHRPIGETEYLDGQLTNPVGPEIAVYTTVLTVLQSIDAGLALLLGWRMWRQAQHAALNESPTHCCDY